MQKNTKRFLTATLCTMALVATGFGVASMETSVAKADTADLVIAGKTLTVANNVNVSFFVPVTAGDRADVKVKVVEQQANGETVEVNLSAQKDNYKYGGTDYYEFIYKGVSAYEMSNLLYANAYLASNPETAGEKVKYSVVHYAYTQLGLTGRAKTDDQALEDLLLSMLNYGTAAAKFQDKDLPADFNLVDEYTYLSIANAMFADGFSYGLYEKGAEIVVTPSDGYGLANGAVGFVANGDDTYTYTVPEERPDLSSAFEVTAGNLEKAEIEADAMESEYSVVAEEAIVLNRTPAEWAEVTISWWNGDEEITGDYTFAEAGTYTFTVKFTCGTEVVEKEVTFTVTASDRQKATAAAEAFKFAYESVTGKGTHTLPTATGEASIAWALKSTTVADNKLSGTTLTVVNENATVVLTATFTYGTATITKDYTVTVAYKDPQPTTSTLSFADKAQRTSFSGTQQVWEQNGITFTNDKAASTNAVADYAKPVRLYANSKITVKASGLITKIVFDCNSSSYATALKNSIGATVIATVSSDKVTVEFNTSVDEFVIEKLSGQVRMDAITVTALVD